jgi:hypothetical protein
MSPKKKISVLLLMFVISGLAIWGVVLGFSFVIDLFKDDPYDPNDDYDWLWVFAPLPVWLFWSFYRDAEGAARNETERDFTADMANRMHLKNNSAQQEKSKEQRLVELESLFQQGVIDKSEYVSSRLKIIGE